MYRDSYIKVNVDYFKDNINYLKKLNDGKEPVVVLKANAYGLGDYEMCRACKEEGVKLIAVSSLDEAINIKEFGIDTLILGYVDPKDFKVVKENNFIIDTVSKDYVKSARKEDLNGLRFHIKVDTGMNRIGLNNFDDVKEVLDYLLENNASVEGIFTHYAVSDLEDKTFTDLQFNKFKDIVKRLNYKFKYVHSSNTDASVDYHEDFTNAFRSGLGFFGYSSFKSDLKPTAGLFTRVTNIKQVKKGESIGYGRTYTTEDDEWIATVPIGYADGFMRANKNGRVYLNGKYFNIVGNICMDQMMIKVDANVKVGDEVELFGEHVTLDEVASRCNFIVYEQLTILDDRLTRKYYTRDGEKIKVITPRFE